MQTLRGDLLVSGRIDVTDDPRGSCVVEMRAADDQLEGGLWAPDGSEVFRRVYKRGSLAHDIHQFADDIVLVLTGQPGIAMSQIAFIAPGKGAREIHLCDYDGRNRRPVTRDGGDKQHPAFAHRGRSIVYTRYLGGRPELSGLDLASGSSGPLFGGGTVAQAGTLSVDGSRVAFVEMSGPTPRLGVAKASGASPKTLITRLQRDSAPSWSPNGDELLFSATPQGEPGLFFIGAKGGKPRPIDTGGPAIKPDWSPDGRRIAYVHVGGTARVQVLDLATRQIKSLGAGTDPCWGADSRHLLVVSGGSLIRVDVDAGHRKTLVSGVGTVLQPTWTR